MPISPGNNVVLNWTNPGIKGPITVPPGTADTSSSSIALIGQGYPGWAVPLLENFLHILENFASSGAPPNPTKGQLWWDPSAAPDGRLYVCTDNVGPEWREIISIPDVFVGINPPDPAELGYLWFEPVTLQMSVCVAATIVSPPTDAVWEKLLTFDSIISATAPAFPRVDGQFWYDSIGRVLYSWNETGSFWQQIGPTKDIDVIAGTGWNDAIVWLNKILSTPTNTLDNLDPFTEFNSWGYNQILSFGPYYSDVPSDEWLRFYDTVLGLGTLLGISTTGLIKQDFHLPGAFSNQYGIPFMLDQWEQITTKIEEFKDGRMQVDGQSLVSSNSYIVYSGTVDAGNILSISSPDPQGFADTEVWTVVATSATNFTVTGSISGPQAAATVDVPYSNGIIDFTINSGTNPFVSGDQFLIYAYENLKDSYTTNWGAGDTGINTTFTLAFDDINHQRAYFNAGGKLKFTPTFADTTAGHNLFWNEFLTTLDHILVDYRSTSYGDPIVVTDPANLGYYDLTTSWQTILYVDARIMTSGATRSVGYQAPFAAGTVTPGGSNVGNGTVGAITVIDQDPLTSISEIWTLTALDDTTFTVEGSVSGLQSDLTVGTPYANAYISFTLSAGGTAFDTGDTFTFEVSGVSNYVKLEAKIDVNPNNLLFKLTLNDTTTVATDNVTTGPTVVELDLIKASATFLNNPEIPYPAVSVSGWTP